MFEDSHLWWARIVSCLLVFKPLNYVDVLCTGHVLYWILKEVGLGGLGGSGSMVPFHCFSLSTL